MLHAALSSLLRIDRHRRRALRKALAPCQYVGTMHLIVRYISRNPGASQEEIACFFALDKASAARDAKRLEDMGHIRREIDPSNRRQYRLYLTEAGEEMLAVIDRAYEDFQSRLAAGFSPEGWGLLTAPLARLGENSQKDL